MRRHAARLARGALGAVAFLLVAAVVAAGALAWRLSRGPISLDFLTPRIAAALAPASGSVQFEIGGTEIAWAGRERGLDLRVRDVRVLTAPGRAIATLPAIAVDLSVEALLQGSLEPSTIDLLGPSLQLVLRQDGTLDLGVGDAGDTPEGKSLLQDLVRELRSGREETPTASVLTRLAVSDGTLVMQDLESGETWRAPDLDLSVTRDDGETRAELGGALEVGGDHVGFRGEALLPSAGGAHGDVRLTGLRTAALAERIEKAPSTSAVERLEPLVPALRTVELSFDGRLAVELDAAWKPQRAEVELTAPTGSVPIGGRRESVRDLSLRAQVDLVRDTAHLSTLALVLGGTAIRGSAAVEGLTASGAAEAEVEVKALPVDLAWRGWPESAAESAREWLTTNISRGTIPEVRVRIAAQHTAAEALDVSGVQVEGAVRYDGLRVRFLDTMPAIDRVAGGGTFTQTGFDLGVDRGVVDGVSVGPRARVVISGLDQDPPRIAIDAPLKGSLAGALAVLDSPPIEAAKALGVRPHDASGTLAGSLRLAFELGDDPELDDLGLHGKARLSGAALPDVIDDWSVSDGEIDVEVDAQSVRLSGSLAVEGAPVQLTWTESLQPKSKLERSLSVRGSVDAAARKRLGFDLEPWLTGPVGVRFDLEQARGAPGRGVLAADLSGAAIDVPPIGWKKPTEVPGTLAATLTMADAESISAIDPFSIDAGGLTASGRATRDATGTRWRRIELDATIAAGGPRQSPGSARIAVDGVEKGYDLRLTSNDTGSLFRTIGLYADAVGGALTLSGTLDTTRESVGFAGKVEIDKVRVVRAPLLARVAGLASFRGVADAFSPSGAGISFDRISADLARSDEVVTIGNGVAAGPTLGLLMTGTVDQKADQVALRGTLVPALYGINQLLPRIPVVGWVVGDRPGGPIGVDFSLDGPAADPRVAVHPLQSLTPGIVGRFLDAIDPRTRAR